MKIAFCSNYDQKLGEKHYPASEYPQNENKRGPEEKGIHMRKICEILLILTIILTLITGIAAAENTGYWGGAGAYSTEENTQNNNAQENPDRKKDTNEDFSDSLFIQEFQKISLSPAETYVNSVLTKVPVLSDLGLSIFINNIELSLEGEMVLSLRVVNMSETNVAFQMRAECAVGNGEMKSVLNSGTGITYLFTDPEFSSATYLITVSNLDMEDVLLRIRIVMFNGSNEASDCRQIDVPIHFLGDYTDAMPKGETHLPVLSDRKNISISPEAVLIREEGCTVTLTNVISDAINDGMELDLIMTADYSYDNPLRFRMNNLMVNGIEQASEISVFIEQSETEIACALHLPYSPESVESISFMLTGYNAETSVSSEVNLFFDAESSEPAEEDPGKTAPEEESGIQLTDDTPAVISEEPVTAHLPAPLGEETREEQPITLIEQDGFKLEWTITYREEGVLALEGNVITPFEGEIDTSIRIESVNGVPINYSFDAYDGWAFCFFEDELAEAGINVGAIESVTFSSVKIYRVLGYQPVWDEEGEEYYDEPVIDRQHPVFKTGPITLIFDQ